jgi:hypothetical protein
MKTRIGETAKIEADVGPIAAAGMSSLEKKQYLLDNFCPASERDRAQREINEEFGGFCNPFD